MIERLYPGGYVTELPSSVHPIEGVSTSTGTETLHPGVFVEEVPFSAKPIDGVSTSTPAPAPPWTGHHPADPGGTQLELFAWLADGLLYRAGLVGDADSHARRHRHPPL